MKELTDEQIEALAQKHESFGFGRADGIIDGLGFHGFDIDELFIFARAVIAADRALNAPADHEGVLQQIASLLTVMFSGARAHVHGDDKSVSGYTIRSGALHKIVGLLSSAGYPVVIPANLPTAHETITGILLSVDDSASADRDVMRQVPDGWRLVPKNPDLDQYNAACRAYVDWQAKCQEEARAHENEPSESWFYSQPHFTHTDVYIAMLAAAPTPPVEQPIDMVLHCPACGMQHIDAPETVRVGTYRDGVRDVEDFEVWSNPPHRSHLCHGCGHIWRPADVPTNGVAAVKTKGKADSPIATPVDHSSEQEPVAWLTPGGDVTRSKVFADEQSALSFGQQRPTPLYTQPSPSLAELRAKVEALQKYRWAANETWLVGLDDVLAEIDKMGGRA